jgi:hypothetical protein
MLSGETASVTAFASFTSLYDSFISASNFGPRQLSFNKLIHKVDEGISVFNRYLRSGCYIVTSPSSGKSLSGYA